MIGPALEMKFLVACLPEQPGHPPGLGRIAALAASGPLDWNRLLELAGHHGFLPLLSEALGRLPALSGDCEAVPVDLRLRLIKRQHRHARSSLCAASAVIELATRFRQRGLRIACWKGPVLAQELLGSCMLRECGDLDFLVSPHQLPAAMEEVEAAGFERHLKSDTPLGLSLVAEMDQEMCFFRRTDGIYLELHTATMSARLQAWQETATLLAQAQPASFRNSEVLTLSPEDLLLSLCGHGIKHHWERLKWIADIALFLDIYRDRLNWVKLVADARRTHRLNALLHSCGLASSIFARQLPDLLAQEWQATRLSSLLEMTERLAELRMSGHTGAPSDRDVSLQLSLLCSGNRGRMSLWLRRLRDPALEDLASGDPRFRILTKWRRLYRRLGWWGIVEKARASLRTT